jgi:hypothetical protein
LLGSFSSAPAFDSVISSELLGLLAEFRGRQFALLWRGSRDGFGGLAFHDRCDGHANTVTLIRDTGGNIFGGFTPLAWGSPKSEEDLEFSGDDSARSFLCTLRNTHGVSPRRFPLKSKARHRAIAHAAAWGPHFCDIGVSGCCNANALSFADRFGESYVNDTG